MNTQESGVIEETWRHTVDGEECEGLEQEIRRGRCADPHMVCALLFLADSAASCPALLSPLTLPQGCSDSLLPNGFDLVLYGLVNSS